jgi:uncharacterized protein YodC (DUF2158 family)
MTEEITVGSVVQLKSGGPKMTVTSTKSMSDRKLITCEWFDGSKQGRDSFPPEALNVVAENAVVGPIQVGPTRPWS